MQVIYNSHNLSLYLCSLFFIVFIAEKCTEHLIYKAISGSVSLSLQ